MVSETITMSLESPAAPVAPRPTVRTLRTQTMGEEIANAITHGVGALVALVCLVVAVAFAAVSGDPWKIVSVSIYGLMMLLLYVNSTLYHAVTQPRAKEVLKVLDHASINLMIAGSYTPFCLVPLRLHSTVWAWSVLCSVWALAILCVVLQTTIKQRYSPVFTGMYLLMGWIMVVAIYPLWQVLGTAAVLWIAAGGIAYTLGVLFYARKSLRYGHTIWHLFVLGGSGIHYYAILTYVVLPPFP